MTPARARQLPLDADPFQALLGSARGSKRQDPPAPALDQALGLPWEADAAAGELVKRIAAGELDMPARACEPFAEALKELWRHDTTARAQAPQLRVLGALLEHLCADAQAAWAQNAPALWSFCGFRVARRAHRHRERPGLKLTFSDGVPQHDPQDLPAFASVHRRALRDALIKNAALSWSDTFSLATLEKLASDSYPDAVCVLGGELLRTAALHGDEVPLARLLGSRGAVRGLRRRYDAYQTVVRDGRYEPAPLLGFEDACAELPVKEWAHCVAVALSNMRRTSPEYALDKVRERKGIVNRFVANALKSLVAERNPDVGSP